MVELAVRAGADVFARDRRGRTAYDGHGKDDRVRVFLRQFTNQDTTLIKQPPSTDPPEMRGYLNNYPINDDAQSSVYGLNPSPAARHSLPQPQLLRQPPRRRLCRRKPGQLRRVHEQARHPRQPAPIYASPRQRARKRLWIIGGLLAVTIIAAAVVIVLCFAVIKPHNSSDKVAGGSSKGSGTSGKGTATSSGASPTASGTPAQNLVVTGGDGSTVTMDNGATFTYYNSFGGVWYWDPKDPFDGGARAQSWSPALNETFNCGVDRIRVVNLCGWLNTEPFIAPALYEPNISAATPAIDEWTLSQNLAAGAANGGLQRLEDHYKTFITEQDFAQIAAAGLNWVCIPLPYWAIETRDNEPFLAKTCCTYFLKAVQWARKYCIRINLDLHALHGSQNDWNHSGRFGRINVLNRLMGLANAQRSLDHIRVLAEFMSQPEYSDVVAMFGVTNEPQAPTFAREKLARYRLQAYNIVRKASGVGEGKGPFISFHEGFAGLSHWVGYFAMRGR